MTDFWIQAAVIWGIATLSSYAQAISGFGFAMLAIPLMIPLVGPQSAVVIATGLGFALTIGSSVAHRSFIQWRPVLTISAAALFGIPVGLVIIQILEERWLTLAIGVVVIAATILLARHAAWRSKSGGVVVGAGVLSGVMLSSTGINGPPVVGAFQSLGMRPREFRASLQATFALQGVLTITGFLIIGLLDFDVFILAITSLPFLVIGWVLGSRTFNKLSPRTFRIVVLATLMVSGIIAIVQAVLQFTGA